MLQIYICEDNLSHKKQIEACVKDCVMIHNLEVGNIFSATHPEPLLDRLNEMGGTGLYFLDIDLKHELNGLDLAMAIRKYDPRGYIVFVTSHDEALPMTFKYKVEAMDFILKDNFYEIKEKIYECILHACDLYSQNTNKSKDRYSFSIFDKFITVEYDEIIFFETSSNHKVLLHTTQNTYEYYSSLGIIEKEVGNSFYRCHKSFLINVKNVSQIDTSLKLVYFKQGSNCLISKRKIKTLMELTNKSSTIGG